MLNKLKTNQFLWISLILLVITSLPIKSYGFNIAIIFGILQTVSFLAAFLYYQRRKKEGGLRAGATILVAVTFIKIFMLFWFVITGFSNTN